MSVGYGIFPTESLNSWKIINVSRISYISNNIFKFLKLINFSGIKYLFNRISKFLRKNKCQRDKVSVQQNLQILKISKCHWDKFSSKKNLQPLKTINVNRITYLSNRLKNNKSPWEKVSFKILKQLINFSWKRYFSKRIFNS